MAVGNVGLLGCAQPSAAVWAAPYTCPTGFSAAIEVIFNNTNGPPSVAHINWAISTQTSTPLAAEVRETGTPVLGAAPMTVTTSIGAGQKVWFETDTAGVNCLVYGFEGSVP